MAQFYFDYRDNQGRLDTDGTGSSFRILKLHISTSTRIG
jgi:hypothetical protein